MKPISLPVLSDDLGRTGFEKLYKHPEKEKILRFLDTYPFWEEYIHRDFGELTGEELWNYTKQYARIKRIPIRMGRYMFYFTFPDILFEKLHHIDTTVGGTLITSGLIPKGEQDRYYLKGLIDESIASSQIEGAATTKKIAEQMLQSGRKPKNRDERMIINNFYAMQYVGKNAHENLTSYHLLQLQSIVTLDTLDDATYVGNWRQSDDIVVADVITGEVFHTPPPHQDLPQLMADFILFFNNESHAEHFIHPIIRAIIIHFLIGWIHPFYDGNGRTARSLFHWYTLKNRYHLMPYLSVSQMILDNKTQYGRAYRQTEMDENDLTYFILYNIKQIEKAWNKLEVHIQKNLQKEKKFKETHISNGLNMRQAEILSWYEKDQNLILTIQDTSTRMLKPKQTVRSDLEGLVEKNQLKRIPINKKTYGYIYP